MVKVGDKIKLKSYEKWEDYKRHLNQEAVIIEAIKQSDFDFRVMWVDKDTSLVAMDNIIQEEVNTFMVLYDNLIKLTDEQKEGLNADDQALVQAGVIMSTLQLVNSTYVLNFLFKQNKEAIAKQAAQDVADVIAEHDKQCAVK